MMMKASREYAFDLDDTAACVARYDVKLMSVGIKTGSDNEMVRRALGMIAPM